MEKANMSNERLIYPGTSLSESLVDLSNLYGVRGRENSRAEKCLKTPSVSQRSSQCFDFPPVPLHPVNLNFAVNPFCDMPLDKVKIFGYSVQATVKDYHTGFISALDKGTQTQFISETSEISTNKMHEEENVTRKAILCASEVRNLGSFDRSTLGMQKSEIKLSDKCNVECLQIPGPTKNDIRRGTECSTDTMINATAGCACKERITHTGRNMKSEANVGLPYSDIYDAQETAKNILQNISEQMMFLKLEFQCYGTAKGPQNQGKTDLMKEELEDHDCTLTSASKRLKSLCYEDEARIWAELELEIERDLELEIKAKIMMLNKRLEDLHVVQSKRLSNEHLSRDLKPVFMKDALEISPVQNVNVIKDETVANVSFAADTLPTGGNGLPLQGDQLIKPPSSTACSIVDEPLQKISSRKIKATSAIEKGISIETPETRWKKHATQTCSIYHSKKEFLNANSRSSRVVKHGVSGRIVAAKSNEKTKSMSAPTHTVEIGLRKFDWSQTLRSERHRGGISESNVPANTTSLIRSLFSEDGSGNGSLSKSRMPSPTSCFYSANSMKSTSALSLPDEDASCGSAKCSNRKRGTVGKQCNETQNKSDLKPRKGGCILQVPLQRETSHKFVARPVVWK